MHDVDWNAAPAFGRRQTILLALKTVAERTAHAPVIVESGTLRSAEGRDGDGWSTVAWAWFASATGGRVTTIDVSAEALAACRRATEPWASAVDFVQADAAETLENWRTDRQGTIDLLYLDSLDYVDEVASERQCLREARAAFAKLSARACVLIDDVRLTGPPTDDGRPRFFGKGALAIPWLCEQGLQFEWAFGGQALLSRAPRTDPGDNLRTPPPPAAKLRILLSSNAPWVPTGYGVQTRLVVERWRALGHEVAIHCNFGLEGGSIGWDGLPMYPRGEQHPFGHEILAAHAGHFRADLTVFLGDAWVVDHDLLDGGPPFVPWFPVDSDPIPPQVADRVRRSWRAIAFSRFGVRKAAEAGIDCEYVPLMIDAREYRPRDRRAAREAFGLPQDAFVIGMVAANKDFPSRKAFPQVMAAFAEFRRRHRDAILYLHTQTWTRRTGGGTDLAALARCLGIENCVRFADPYVVAMGAPPSRMAELYSAFNVLAAPSLGEGFGVPIVEAQACGCPVIVGDWTSMSEVCSAGVKIALSDAEPFWTPLHAWQFVPRVGALVEAFEHVRRSAGGPGLSADAARSGATAYDADRVVREHWVPVLARFAAALTTQRGRA